MLILASIARIRGLMASLNQRSTSNTCVRAVAARCTGRVPGRRRYTASHFVTTSKVVAGTSRLAGAVINAGSSLGNRTSWSTSDPSRHDPAPRPRHTVNSQVKHPRTSSRGRRAPRRRINDGRITLLVTETRETVRALNERARADRLVTGETGRGRAVQLRDGLQASVGDVIVTRRNDRRLMSWSRGP